MDNASRRGWAFAAVLAAHAAALWLFQRHAFDPAPDTAPASAPRLRIEARLLTAGEAAARPRRAVRESALAGGTPAQRAVEAGAAWRTPTAAARLSGAIERSGTGDCMKGEYVGGGLGLLSLPFLAAAAARGDCAK